jgi:hypothetical protein
MNLNLKNKLHRLNELSANLNYSERKALFKKIKVEALKQSLFMLAKFIGYKDITKYTHGDMIKALESPKKRKLIVMPRGSLKSSVSCVAYPIWLLIKNPNLRILLDSEVYSNAKNFLREIRLLVNHDDFIELFGLWDTDKWSEGECIISARTKPKKEGSITCGGVGTVKVGQHYDVIICDDLNSNNNSQTKEGCQKVIDHYRYLISILEPEGTLVVVGTRYSMRDTIQFILDNEILNVPT